MKEEKVRIEHWQSSEGRTEVHFFRTSDDEYLFGYNPQLLPSDMRDELLRWADSIK